MYYRIKVDNEYIESFKDFGEYHEVTYTLLKTKAMRIVPLDYLGFELALRDFGFNMSLVEFEKVSYVGYRARLYFPDILYANF